MQAADSHLGQGLKGDRPGVQEQTGLQGGQGMGVRPQGCQVVGIQLEGEYVTHRTSRGFAVAVYQGRVDVADLELHPSLVEGEGPVHLHVAFTYRREGSDRVEGLDEREGLAGQEVAAPRAGEPDLGLGEAHCVTGPVD